MAGKDTTTERESLARAGKMLRESLARGGNHVTQEQAENRVKQARKITNRKLGR